MGRDKALLTLPDGRRLWERQLGGAARSWGRRSCSSPGAKREGFPADVPCLADDPAGGRAAGRDRGGVGAMQRERLVVLAVDLPAMTPGFLRGLLAEAAGEDRQRRYEAGWCRREKMGFSSRWPPFIPVGRWHRDWERGQGSSGAVADEEAFAATVRPAVGGRFARGGSRRGRMTEPRILPEDGPPFAQVSPTGTSAIIRVMQGQALKVVRSDPAVSHQGWPPYPGVALGFHVPFRAGKRMSAHAPRQSALTSRRGGGKGHRSRRLRRRQAGGGAGVADHRRAGERGIRRNGGAG